MRSSVALILGEVYESLGEYQRSHELLEHSLRLRRLEPERALDLAHSLQATGTSHRIAGDYDAAVAAFQEALELRWAAVGERHPDVADTLNGLAIVKRRQGFYDEAEALYRRSLRIRQDILGPEHPAVARSLNNLALFGSRTATNRIPRLDMAAPRLERLLRRHGFPGPLIPRFTRLRATQTLPAPKPLLDYGDWPRALGASASDASPTGCLAEGYVTEISTTGISPRSTSPDSRTSIRRVGGAGGRFGGKGPTKARAGG